MSFNLMHSFLNITFYPLTTSLKENYVVRSRVFRIIAYLSFIYCFQIFKVRVIQLFLYVYHISQNCNIMQKYVDPSSTMVLHLFFEAPFFEC